MSTKATDKIVTFNKNKRAVSAMIGYILLITFAVVISAVIYTWLKGYVPTEGIDCPEDVGVYVSKYKNDSGALTIYLKNNGRFDISGFVLHYSDDASKEIGTIPLAKNYAGSELQITSGNTLEYKIGEEMFSPNDDVLPLKFEFEEDTYIYSIDITPKKNQEYKNKIYSALCTNAKTKEILDITITQ